MKKLTGWIIAFIAATVCLAVGYFVIPAEPATRTLGGFLYVYICIELATQIAISRRKDKQDRLREQEKIKNKDNSGS